MNEYRATPDWINREPLTTVEVSQLYFCLEYRSVEVYGQEMSLCRDLNKNRIVFLQKNSLCVILTKKIRENEVLP